MLGFNLTKQKRTGKSLAAQNMTVTLRLICYVLKRYKDMAYFWQEGNSVNDKQRSVPLNESTGSNSSNKITIVTIIVLQKLFISLP